MKIVCIFIQISLKFIAIIQLIIGSDDGLAANSRQAISWTNVSPFYDAMICSIHALDNCWDIEVLIYSAALTVD